MLFADDASDGTWIAVGLAFVAMVGTAINSVMGMLANRDKLKFDREAAAIAQEAADLKRQVDALQVASNECKKDREQIVRRLEICTEQHEEANRRHDASERERREIQARLDQLTANQSRLTQKVDNLPDC